MNVTDNPLFQQGVAYERERIRAALQRLRGVADDEGTNAVEEVWQPCVRCGNDSDGAGDPR